MKKIGEGWQYKVYDLENGRVLKKWRAILLQYFFVYFQELRKKQSDPFRKTIVDVPRVRRMGYDSVAYIKNNLLIIDKKIIGNPVFLKKYDYEQDRITSLKEAFSKSSVEEIKRMLDSYVELIFATWRYGFSDAMYGFLNNNGLNKNGEVVQIDFGELLFSKDQVKKRILNKRWLLSHTFITFKESEIKTYYQNIMEKNMTLENLNKYWGKSLSVEHSRSDTV
ncbi:MAG: hypothetical protein WC264_02310 [Candidatus Paceibacterota bacterium]|jgi:hypothetical protein